MEGGFISSLKELRKYADAELYKMEDTDKRRSAVAHQHGKQHSEKEPRKDIMRKIIRCPVNAPLSLRYRKKSHTSNTAERCIPAQNG